MKPHLSQLNVMAHRNYFRRNNLQILKSQIDNTYKDWRSLFLVQIGTKHEILLICNSYKEISVASSDDTIEVYFLLGINILGLCSEKLPLKEEAPLLLPPPPCFPVA